MKATSDLVSHEKGMEDERERRLHRAAVQAVIVELTSNSVALAAMRERGGIIEKYGAVDTSAYDALLVPLYSRLGPYALAPVARAYSRLHIFKDKPLIIATEHQAAIEDGLQALIRYASNDLGIVLNVPE